MATKDIFNTLHLVTKYWPLVVSEPGSYIAQVDLQLTYVTKDDHDLGMCFHAQFLW